MMNNKKHDLSPQWVRSPPSVDIVKVFCLCYFAGGGGFLFWVKWYILLLQKFWPPSKVCGDSDKKPLIHEPRICGTSCWLLSPKCYRFWLIPSQCSHKSWVLPFCILRPHSQPNNFSRLEHFPTLDCKIGFHWGEKSVAPSVCVYVVVEGRGWGGGCCPLVWHRAAVQGSTICFWPANCSPCLFWHYNPPRPVRVWTEATEVDGSAASKPNSLGPVWGGVQPRLWGGRVNWTSSLLAW